MTKFPWLDFPPLWVEFGKLSLPFLNPLLMGSLDNLLNTPKGSICPFIYKAKFYGRSVDTFKHSSLEEGKENSIYEVCLILESSFSC